MLKCRAWLHPVIRTVLHGCRHAQTRRELQQLPFLYPGSLQRRKCHSWTWKHERMHAGHVNEVYDDSLTLVRHPLLKMYLSGMSAICRLEILAADAFKTLLEELKKSRCYVYSSQWVHRQNSTYFSVFFFFLKKVLNRLLKISGLSTFPGFKSGPSEFLIEYPCFTSLNLP